jgi:RNA polymerase sigma-70 factor, ECF subfamily
LKYETVSLIENMQTAELVLLKKARSFDQDALSEIFDLYAPGIYRYAYRLLGDADQADDCVSVTFSRFLQALKNGGGPQDHLKAYLYRVAHNWVIDGYHRGPLSPLPLQEEAAWPQEGPDQTALDRIEQDRVRAAVRCLTPEQRQVIMLKFLEGWENDGIAAAIGKPVGAVKALQHRAINALRRMLLKEGEVRNESK